MANSERRHPPFGHGIKVLLQQRKSASGPVPRIVQRVIGHFALNRISPDEPALADDTDFHGNPEVLPLRLPVARILHFQGCLKG